MDPNTSTISQDEKKEKIRNFFVEISDDKFTKVKVVKCKHSIEWSGAEVANSFMIAEKTYSHKLKLTVDYRRKEDIDSVFFVFTYVNTDDGYPNMNDLTMYLILDNNKTIHLEESSGFDHVSKSEHSGDSYYTIYLETAQLSVPVSDMIATANAEKIDYSIRFGQGKLEGAFTKEQLNILKGFYNATFDEDFEVETLINATNTIKPKTVSTGSCYIATMAYGNYDHPQVVVLRKFRDNYLACRKWGQNFISIYYNYSPWLVNRLKHKKRTNKIIRKLLDFFIWFIRK
jgi:hypothetical protein